MLSGFDVGEGAAVILSRERTRRVISISTWVKRARNTTTVEPMFRRLKPRAS